MPRAQVHRSAKSRFGSVVSASKAISKTAEATKKALQTINPIHADGRPAGLPAGIPVEASDAFFASSLAIQKDLMNEAAKPNRIQVAQRPKLRSSAIKSTGGTLCLCKEMRHCPLVAAEDPADDPNFDGLTYQFYPTDQGWWQMRDTCLQLARMSGVQAEEVEL